jgi:NAD(P)-dependent dehydrogenase (short-subunit alcohol dehydrogenase family)
MAQAVVAGIKPGLRVLVTAGASGIGRAIAAQFHAAGARVHICDVAAEALGNFGKEFPAIGRTLTDVSDPKAVDRLFDEAVSKLGGLDVMVNNAGIAGPTKPVDQVTVEEWDRTIAVDLSSMFYCARRAAPLLRASGEGAMINLSSTAGKFGFPNRSPYAAAKWGVIGFTQSLAVELGPAGVRVNAILPGPVEGDRIDRVVEARSRLSNKSKDEVWSEMLHRSSLNRPVSPNDIANMALFLCSPAGRNITGQSLAVCAGVTGM